MQAACKLRWTKERGDHGGTAALCAGPSFTRAPNGTRESGPSRQHRDAHMTVTSTATFGWIGLQFAFVHTAML